MTLHVLRYPRLHHHIRAVRRAGADAFHQPVHDADDRRSSLAAGGTIDKYMGDCIMAFWNAPLDDPAHHARTRCRAALRCAPSWCEFNATLRRGGGGRGASRSRRCRSASASTPANAASATWARSNVSTIRARRRGQLASRLEGHRQDYGVDIVIGEQTAAGCPHLALLELDLILVKGKTQAGHVYTLPPERIEHSEFGDRHSALLRAYRHQDWAAALRLLDDGRLIAARHLAPVYDLYRRQILHFQSDAPPAIGTGCLPPRTNSRCVAVGLNYWVAVIGCRKFTHFVSIRNKIDFI